MNLYMKNFDFLDTKEKHFSFERYFHFVNEYEFTIYLDNDVYIFPDADLCLSLMA